MRQLSWLTLVEASGLVIWLVLAVALVTGPDKAGDLVPIDPAALEIGEAQETWMGIYFHGQKVGYAANSEAPTGDGGVLIRNRSAFTVASFNQINQIVTAGNAVIDAEGRLRAFDFFMSADPVRIAARGEVRGKQILIELLQAGEVERVTLDVDEPPQMSVSLNRWFAAKETVNVGDRYEVPYFDPVTLAQSRMVVEVVDVELLPSGEEAWWLERHFGDATTRALITAGGETIREEGAMGIAMVRETPEIAQTMPVNAEPVDIIALSAVKLSGRISDPRTLASLDLRILGVEPDRVRNDPPVQQVEGDVVHIRMPVPAELPAGVPRLETDPAFAAALAPTAFLPVQHPEILAKAEEVVGGIDDRREAAERLTDWVHEYLYKAPTIGVPNALEVLRVGQGDCNEHTALYVALARAAGMPARIAAGVVFSDRIGSTGAFYYHAWPEVWMGEAGGWVPVDPTFGQFPADATHVKLVEGDLERQIEIMGVMGRLGFERVKTPEGEPPG
ncbi:MAG: transglutaminase domain-containing protein [Alphaproteobacteria bacterium]|nr:transglutaminase domain-containing protein [Alphaproteobacteria bacterium]MCB9793555.1 transglutaminase domain-containing protein [Alphaproteobacteria bacterium]